MTVQVEASTVAAGALFGQNRFIVPDFQRDYAWRPEQQVEEFWLDLSEAVTGSEDYFLGLVILTEAMDAREVADGQQRLVTITVLANALRLVALDRKRRLVAESLRKNFLFDIDYVTEVEHPRMQLSDDRDATALSELLDAPTLSSISEKSDSLITAAHHYLVRAVREDLESVPDSDVRLGQWGKYLTESLRFAVFVHPNNEAAYRVYEVINTRGKDLTPADLIKSYLMRSSSKSAREETYASWKWMSSQFDEISEADQLTTFVRHVVTLDRGYVIPRNLYREVNREYKGNEGVQRLMKELIGHLSTYLQMLDPSLDGETPAMQSRAFSILREMDAGRFRPIFLEAAKSPNAETYFRALIAIIVPGVVAGRFGGGSIEAKFSRAARRIHEDPARWDQELDGLRELRPERQDFVERLSKKLPRSALRVLRSSLVQQSAVPELAGYVHQIRPRNAQGWYEFTEEEYREFGGTIGNSVLVSLERRPQGARDFDAVKSKLLSQAVEGERGPVAPDVDEWTIQDVLRCNISCAEELAGIWYGNS